MRKLRIKRRGGAPNCEYGTVPVTCTYEPQYNDDDESYLQLSRNSSANFCSSVLPMDEDDIRMYENGAEIRENNGMIEVQKCSSPQQDGGRVKRQVKKSPRRRSPRKSPRQSTRRKSPRKSPRRKSPRKSPRRGIIRRA